LRARHLLIGLVAVPLAAVATALTTQHVGGLMPCAWCVLQRLIFLTIAAIGVLGLLLPGGGSRRAVAALALLTASSGVSAALWQHFVASASSSCAQSLADKVMSFTGLDGRFPEVFAPYASCAEAKVNLLGVPYEFYSLTLFVLLSLMAVRVVARPA
jgi:disulfide bond formation protein DsbB